MRRAPDFIIGSPAQLRRWWVIPRNPVFNIYLHNILRSDDDRALHDHPWWNISIVLKGGYLEVIPHPDPSQGPTLAIPRMPGSVVFRKATAAHRLEVPEGSADCWTLFLTGPRFRNWGFHCPQGWTPWQDFCEPGNSGQRGRGCGETQQFNKRDNP